MLFHFAYNRILIRMDWALFQQIHYLWEACRERRGLSTEISQLECTLCFFHSIPLRNFKYLNLSSNRRSISPSWRYQNGNWSVKAAQLLPCKNSGFMQEAAVNTLVPTFGGSMAWLLINWTETGLRCGIKALLNSKKLCKLFRPSMLLETPWTSWISFWGLVWALYVQSVYNMHGITMRRMQYCIEILLLGIKT